ncbi:hypothetical protein HCJ52_03110 [Listeria sp. FSL L7-1485]|uniref:Uncharacterized protein n=1 Tax=Listeria immobilis TaxID=2713502 RepID=A0A7X0X8A0_9LIST|nr:hypothetical protein [Listeria immobilis]MBC1489413.1 hypothetical protein [Listeria immobilis]MBC1535114.1 hypothetical protein [Listeria immobilis]
MENNIVGVIGSISAAIAAIASLVTIFLQIRKDTISQKPMLMPKIKYINTELNLYYSDWDSNNKLGNKNSDTVIEIVNLGKGTAIDITYSYELVNKQEIINNAKNESFNNEKLFFAHINTKDYEAVTMGYNNGEGYECSNDYRLEKFIKTVDLINSYESKQIFLPSYFIAIQNFNILFQQRNKFIKPMLKVKIIYKDINLNMYEIKYNLFLSQSFKVSGKRYETSILNKRIQKMKKIK